MDFTKDNFIKFCRKIANKGITINLNDFCGGFGYFEMKPFHNESTISYNIGKIENMENEIYLHCNVNIRGFGIGECIVDENKFLRYAKEIRLHGNFSNKLTDLYNSL